jgi:integrase
VEEAAMHLFKPKYKTATGEYRESANYALAFCIDGKRIVKTLQTPNRATAEAKAKLLIARTKEQGWAVLKPRLPGARLKDLEEFCELYRTWATTKEVPLRRLTAMKSISTLRRIARELGVSSLDQLVGRIPEWRAGQTNSPASVSTDLRSGAAMFTAEAMKYYEAANWTVINPFAGIRAPQPEIKPFEGYPLESIRRLIADAKIELKGKDDPAYAVFLLALCAGLRAQEAAWVQRSHLRPNGVFVESDPEAHVTKNTKSRFVPLPPSVVAELQAIGGEGPFFLADAERPNGNKKVGHKRGYRVLKRLSVWLASKGITYERPIHFLRKVFGSVVATRHGLFAARDYLGHGSVVVTERHYAALLEKPVVDLMAESSAA